MTNTITKITYNGDDYEVWWWWTWDVLVSDQANNILTSWMKIWCGEETDYENLGTYDVNTIYLTIPDQS